MASMSQAPGSDETATTQVDELLASPEFAQALESDHFKCFLDHIPIAIVVSKLMGNGHRIVYANAVFEMLTGKTFGNIEGNGWSVLDRLRQEGNPEIGLGEAVLGGEDFVGTFRLESVSDRHRLIDAYVARIESEHGTESFRLAALVDVTERDRSRREEFERHIRERDLLLKELQHRVRNSLQMVTALIRLEARNVREGEEVNLDSLARRIETLRILYDVLSSDQGSHRVDLGAYLSQIASANLSSYGTEGIRLDLKVESCPVSVSTAMSAGLVVNEAITNAFKYAFTGRNGGTITLQCLSDDAGYCVIIADDGLGLPAGLVWPPPGKISTLIVQSLRENTHATVKVVSRAGEGTKISFVLPVRGIQNERSPPLNYDSRSSVFLPRPDGESLGGG
jgi:two-component sensor histidine kinase